MENLKIKEWLQQGEKEFEEKFECIQSDCDGTGYIPVARSVARQVSETEFVEDVEWEAEQCEFHYKYLIPMKQFISSRQISLTAFLIKMIVEEIKKNKMSRLGLNNKMKDDRFHDRLEINHDISVHNQALDTISSKLKNLIKE